MVYNFMPHTSTPSKKDMSTLRDYISYARTYVNPSLSDEAGQALVQAYVGQWH